VRNDEINEIAKQFDSSSSKTLRMDWVGAITGAMSELSEMSPALVLSHKNISTGEGGMLTTDDPDVAQRVRTLSLHGITKDAWSDTAKREAGNTT